MYPRTWGYHSLQLTIKIKVVNQINNRRHGRRINSYIEERRRPVQKIIYNTQVALNSGVLSLDEAVKRATKEFLDKGINCVQYKNGALVNIASYSEMALRTANKRAKLQGEGADRQEMGFTTVLVAPNGNCCPKCSKYTGKVFIDDVWSGGKKGTPIIRCYRVQ